MIRNWNVPSVSHPGIVQSQGATDRPSDYYSTKQGYGQDEPDTKAYDNTGNESELSRSPTYIIM